MNYFTVALDLPIMATFESLAFEVPVDDLKLL